MPRKLALKRDETHHDKTHGILEGLHQRQLPEQLRPPSPGADRPSRRSVQGPKRELRTNRARTCPGPRWPRPWCWRCTFRRRHPGLGMRSGRYPGGFCRRSSS
eukprot:scaffold256736_cov36-Tisochrysis_lutea.AAC.1